MTKERARELLEHFLTYSGDPTIVTLPVFDQNIASVEGEDIIEEYTFRYLLQVAYDLKEK